MVYAEQVGDELASGLFYQNRPFYLSTEKLQSDYAPVRFDRELRLFRRWCPAGAVLDVGCSTGAFLHQLKTRCPGSYDILGTDLPGPALDYAESRGLPVCREDFLKMDWGEARFDAMTFWAVMEHLAHPKKFLSKATHVLKPGGFCFILVPNLRSLAVRLLGPKYRYIMPEHLNYFTASTLKAFASHEPAMEIVETGSMHFNLVVIWQDLRNPRDIVPDEERGRLLQRTTAWKQSRCVKPLQPFYRGMETLLASLGLADNLFAVLRRK
jgi:2-polyprenyl-3-methyl-5-hydroxy-6-metoxy-1,4-benzoquinol methylase